MNSFRKLYDGTRGMEWTHELYSGAKLQRENKRKKELSFLRHATILLKQEKKRKKSETKMTASVLKQDPNTSKAQKNAIYQGKHNSANFWGNPLYQTTKWWEKKKKRKKKKEVES